MPIRTRNRAGAEEGATRGMEATTATGAATFTADATTRRLLCRALVEAFMPDLRAMAATVDSLVSVGAL
jgi:hypothetical protein